MARNIRVNQSHFAMIPQANIRRSVFDRSHVYKTTFNEGQLIPYFVDEVIPGDTFTLNPVEFCRLATPVVPFMDNIYIESFFFFVPSRLVYDKWVKYVLTLFVNYVTTLHISSARKVCTILLVRNSFARRLDASLSRLPPNYYACRALQQQNRRGYPRRLALFYSFYNALTQSLNISPRC